MCSVYSQKIASWCLEGNLEAFLTPMLIKIAKAC